MGEVLGIIKPALSTSTQDAITNQCRLYPMPETENSGKSSHPFLSILAHGIMTGRQCDSVFPACSACHKARANCVGGGTSRETPRR